MIKLRFGGKVESKAHKYKLGKKIKVNREEKMKESITDNQATIAGNGAAMRLVKRGALATLATAAFALFAGGVANTFRPINAETVQINGNLLGSGFVRLTDGACTAANTTNQDSYNETNNTLDINVLPGAIANNCLGLEVTTDNSSGYTLTMSGPTDGSLKLAGQSIAQKGGAGTSVFATSTNAAEWGFAIPSGQIQGPMNWGFDASYAVLDRANTTNTAKYAAVPKESAPIDTVATISGTQTFDYDVFFGVSAGSNMPTGTYTGTVVFSAVGNAAANVACANFATGFATGCTDNNIKMTLPNGMIPVKYTGTDATPEWTVMSASDINWYDYANKEWANAVTFTTASYKTSLVPGAKLSATSNAAAYNDILGYWVYVPRFEYRLINTGFDGSSHCSAANSQFCPQAFDIRFVNSNTAMKSGTTAGEWLTHPGFQADLNGDGTYGGPGSSEQVDGVWVAKYEASAKNGASVVNCANAAACNLDTLTPSFAPGNNTWSYIDLQNIFTRSQAVPTAHNFTLGTTTGMVNTVSNATWGAATYLSQSLYGVCTTRFCSLDGTPIATDTQNQPNMQKVYNNGYYAGSEPRGRAGCGPTAAASDAQAATCNLWYTVIGKTASTTGNQSGIYDMAGGLWEYTFSNRSNADNTTPNYGSITALSTTSGWNFNKFTDILYRNSDFLNCTSCTDWQPIKFGSFAGLSRYYGTSLAETVAQNTNTATNLGGWGGDYSDSPTATTAPWFIRGGQAANGAGAGVFAFSRHSGAAANYLGWRAVVSGV
jgi:hypothetical protein